MSYVWMLDVTRLWEDPPKGHGASDAKDELLVERVWELLDDETAWVEPPREETWYERRQERRVLVHRVAAGWRAWVFTSHQAADRIQAADELALVALLEERGLAREPHGYRTKREPKPQVETEPPDDGGPPWSHLDMTAIAHRYQLGEEGVIPKSFNERRGTWDLSPNAQLTTRPLWPNQAGRDLSTGEVWWELGYKDQWGNVRLHWLPDLEVRQARPLVDMPGGPVTEGRHRRCAEWLDYASSHVKRDLAEVTSRVGWIGSLTAMRWVWPGGTIRYIGPELSLSDGAKAQAKWRRGVEILVELGQAGLPALTAVAFSAAAPLSRIHGRRNPVLGYASRTSRGKGSAVNYACSLWCDPDALVAPASSTAKGIQDRAAGVPDLPCFLDELQQLLEQGDRGRAQAMDAIYYLANGVRRVTSSKAQTSVGGERRFGVGIYAAEVTVLEGLAAGVQSRVIEISQHPCPDQETAIALQQAKRYGGSWALAYGRHLEDTGTDVIAAQIETWADRLRQDLDDETPLRGDDCDTVAQVCVGLQLLGEVIELDLPVAELERYLLDCLIEQRTRQVDKELDSLQRVVDYVLGATGWHALGGGPRHDAKVGGFVLSSYCQSPHGLLAWKRATTDGPGGEDEDADEKQIITLEINPSVEPLQRLLAEYGGQARVLAAWHEMGWLHVDGRHKTVKKTHMGRQVGRVIRLTDAALQEVCRD